MNNDALAVLFPDTNILLHFRSLREIDWLTVAEAKAVRLVLCSPVLDELDKHKYDPRRKDRAETADGEIQRIEDTGYEVRKGVTLDVLVEAPETDGNQDGGIIRRVLRYRDENPTANVAVVTADTNMSRRCRVQGIKVIRLGKEWMRPVEDEQDRRLRQCQQRLQQLESRLPDVQLLVGFGPDGHPTDCLDVPLIRPAPLDRQKMLNDLKQIYENYGLLGGRNTINKEMVEYEAFFASYEEYLDRLSDYQQRRGLTLPLVFWLSNTGGAPATQVEANITFPSGLRGMVSDYQIRMRHLHGRHNAPVFKFHECPRPLTMPPLPQRIHARSREIKEAESARVIWQQLVQSEILKINTTTCGVFESLHISGNTVTMTCQNAIHNKQHYFGTVFVTLADWETVRPFELPYEIRTADHPEVTHGKIVVRPSVTLATAPDCETAIHAKD